MFRQERCTESGEVHFVESSYDVEEMGGGYKYGPLEDCDFSREREAGVKRAETREGAALVGLEQSFAVGDGGQETTITRSRILDIVVWKSTMRKNAGEPSECFPCLSRNTQFTFLSEGEWYLKGISRARGASRIPGLKRLTFLQTEYGMHSGLGVAEGKEYPSAFMISSLLRKSDERSCDRHPLGEISSFGGKKWSWRASLMETGSEAPGGREILGSFCGLQTV